jgi:3-dehydroquinate synthetase
MSTEVVVGRGVLDQRRLLGGFRPGFVGIITQPGAEAVARRVATALDDVPGDVLVVPDGEAAKTLQSVEDVVGWLLERGMRRDGLVLGVGGGSVTDLTGFVAAVYLRGVAAIYVPTTLVGAVDAAVGGKTGVNVGGKNLVGVFRDPRRVVVDAGILDALPDDLKRQGFAEALKAGLVGDPALVDLIEAHGAAADLETVIGRALAVKQDIVRRDPLEEGERAHLNYGHTVGHAVETVTGWPHGLAVAVGMVAAGCASALELGFVGEDRQRDIVADLGLPTAAAAADPARVRAQVVRDKKRDAGGARMVLLRAIGAPEVVHVGAATVDAALASVGIHGGRRR